MSGGGSIPELYEPVEGAIRVLYPPLRSPLREEGVFTISVGRAGGIFGVPHCPQNDSARLISLPQFGHFIDNPLPFYAASYRYCFTSVYYSSFALAWKPNTRSSYPQGMSSGAVWALSSKRTD